LGQNSDKSKVNIPSDNDNADDDDDNDENDAADPRVTEEKIQNATECFLMHNVPRFQAPELGCQWTWGAPTNIANNVNI